MKVINLLDFKLRIYPMMDWYYDWDFEISLN